MKKLNIAMTVTMANGVDPLDLYPQLKTDVIAAPLVAIVDDEESETHVEQVAVTQFTLDQGGVASFVLDCTVESEFDLIASFEGLRAAISNGLGVAEGDVAIASAEESDMPV